MKIKSLILFVIVSVNILTSCSSSEDTTYDHIPEGEYIGYVSNQVADYICFLGVKFTGENNFTNVDTEERCYSPRYGTYEISGSVLHFADSVLIYETVLDPDIILSGEYDFSFDGVKLILTKNLNETDAYIYELIKS